MHLNRKIGFYEKYIKRIIDVFCSLSFFVFFGWFFGIIAFIVYVKMGSPIIFKQPRPGVIKNGHETIFNMYKFRTMTDERDKDGNLLPDKDRLPKFGAFLRSTSLDELPELFCILKGTMSIVGPRPQLVRDMVFMTEKQRMRHTAKPGLTGLAQVKGRNSIAWKDKFDWDMKYISKVTFWRDVIIVFETIVAVFKRSGITDGENVTALDYGDSLLKSGDISIEKYNELQCQANKIIAEFNGE